MPFNNNGTLYVQIKYVQVYTAFISIKYVQVYPAFISVLLPVFKGETI